MHAIDILIVFLYLGLTFYLGIRFRGRQQSSDDYFTASGLLSGWFNSILVGLSIAATLFSGISFIGTPSLAYREGIITLLFPLCIPILWLVVTFWFLPKFMRLKGRYPYDFIESHFGSSVRVMAAVFFVLLRLGWMATLIYVPTLVLLASTGLGSAWFWPILLAIGIACTIYTTAGGIRGVVVTDALQFLVIGSGVLVIVGFIVANLPLGPAEAYMELKEGGFFELNTLWSLDPRETLTIWSILLGFVIANMSSYVADQMSLQRYIATGELGSAQRSFTVNAISATVVVVFLTLLGLALAAWYRLAPDTELPAQADKVLPYFISHELPVGFSGMIIAAILAATMSSMTSGINSLAGSISNDLRRKFGRKLDADEELGYARKTSLAIGLFSTLGAGFVGAMGSIFDIVMILLGVFLGPLLAPVVLSILNVRTCSWAVVSGMLVGLILGGLVAFSGLSSLWVSVVAFASSLLLPLCVSPFKRNRPV